VCFGLEVRVVAVAPIDPPVGFEVHIIQQAPDTKRLSLQVRLCARASRRQRVAAPWYRTGLMDI
jgi:hypothetical protein